MSSDKPFQKAIACGGILFVILGAGLIVKGVSNFHYRLTYTLCTCLFAALIAGGWGFVSKNQWSWGRFMITVVCVWLLWGAVMMKPNNPQHSARAPKLVFSGKLPSSWKMLKEWPITDEGATNGHAVIVQNEDKRRVIVLQASSLPKSETTRGFRYTADEWKRGVLDSARDSFKAAIQQDTFSIVEVQGREAALLNFQVTTPQFVVNLRNKAWMENNAFVSFQAICRGVAALDDQEIADVLSCIKVLDEK